MKKYLALALIIFSAFLWGCPNTTSYSRGVYMLLDTSGTYKKELKRAEAIISYLLGTLQPGDSLAVARIDSGSFSEKDIVAKMTFDKRPSVANQQKRLFKQKIDDFVRTAKGSAYTDITGGVLQSVEFLNEAGAGQKYILIFSDLKEDLVKGQVRDFPIQVDGCNVVALNVTKLRSDNVDPRDYYQRVEEWRSRVEAGGGTWRVVNDLERLENIFQG
ncbi:MAG: VWA domain-containing protein [Deltaproteobacteria bacterium]|nr:VWA domain-containing protein [Deltaproteobacteria bacterium]